MFDVSFTELMVISVVALIVIGPERLPRVARTVGHLLGRLQRYVTTIKSDINREMHVEDLKRFQERVKADFNSLETGISNEVASVHTAVAEIEAGIKPLADDATAVLPAPTSGADGLRTDSTVSDRAVTDGTVLAPKTADDARRV